MNFRDSLRVLGYVLMFFLSQLIGGVVSVVMWLMQSDLIHEIVNDPSWAEKHADDILDVMINDGLFATMPEGLLISSLLVIVVFWFTRWAERDVLRPTAKGCLWALAVMIPTCISVDIITELAHLGKNENSAMLEKVLLSMMESPLGILDIAVIGPIAEELLFRSAIMGYMMKKIGSTRNGVMWSIAVSAFLFGALHGNPAQSYGAMVFGVVFGIVYWRTGSVIPCILMHILNNSLAVLLTLVCGSEMTMVDLFGGQFGAIMVCTVSMGVIFVLLTRNAYSPKY